MKGVTNRKDFDALSLLSRARLSVCADRVPKAIARADVRQAMIPHP